MRHCRYGHLLRLFNPKTTGLHPFSPNSDFPVDGSESPIGCRPVGSNSRRPCDGPSTRSASEPPSAGKARRRFTNECASKSNNGHPQRQRTLDAHPGLVPIKKFAAARDPSRFQNGENRWNHPFSGL
jgi:hypothetical protein